MKSPAGLSAEARRVRRFIDTHVTRLNQNLRRVRNLVETYLTLHGSGRGKRRIQDADVLRAAVVLLHASLEDFVRAIAAVQLPFASEQALNAVPIVGTGTGRPEKFYLGRLAQHRGMTVDEVIARSVAEHLESSNYNNVGELRTVLLALGIPVDKVEGYFPDLQAMMQRRHRIVHRADRVESPGRGRQHAEPISPRTVERWVEAVENFAIEAMTSVSVQQSVSRIHSNLRKPSDA